MKIFFVLSGYRPYIGGAEQQTRCLADELCSMGHIVELLVVDQGKATGDALESLSAQFSGPARPDVVHLVDSVDGALVDGTCSLVREHGGTLVYTPATDQSLWGDSETVWRAIREADLVLAMNETEQRALAAVRSSGVECIEQGGDLGEGTYDLRAELGIPTGAPVLLFVGRKMASKGYAALVQAGPIIWDSRPDTRLVFVGPAVDTDAEVLISQLGDPRVIDLGVVSEKIKTAAYEMSTIVCLPSRADVFPMVIVEAWAARRPLLLGPFDGGKCFIEEGVALACGDTPGTVAASAVHLLDHPDMAEELADRGYARYLGRHSWSAVARQHLDLYSRVVFTPSHQGTGI
ncbi:glycosyltransferase [Actinomyces viscosus]|uniref:D-inositol-3-phosphate glycosyltransferase n=1 Tax=Actinomyces viscosus TaxID=1656 RepID=A0A3S4Z7G9_ACTVI|nr:glycosyltransferase family 4 protein [Actinomyces viscosus]TFH52894.1 glycosyltransferase [Actinomyces viscosus]VEI14829.1 D-inositol-3-phosphate glycosyltransferase [Actinomyces viscosus]